MGRTNSRNSSKNNAKQPAKQFETAKTVSGAAEAFVKAVKEENFELSLNYSNFAL